NQTIAFTIPRGDIGPAGNPTQWDLRGTGSPEGAVTAPVGSIYTDTAATNGAIRWIKQTGTGNTGWRVQWGDTGARQIVPSLLNGWTANASFSFIRRVNDTVWLMLASLNWSAATSDTFLDVVTNLPGFQRWPGAVFRFPVGLQGMSGADSAAANQGRFMTSSNTNVLSLVRSQMPGFDTSPSITANIYVSWYVTAAWPTTLP
ncbi:MAG: hypothetical protein J2P16_07100, partial [Mycobacterium sp.]|nr:hypothetical protein [Mycobacterium sp.]